MDTNKGSTLSVNDLKCLPAFAAYLLQRLRVYAEYQLSLCEQMNLPMLKAFSNISRENLVALGMDGGREYLSYLAENNAEQQIESSLIKWIKNQLPQINQRDIVAEDIMLMTYIRKKTFLHFLREYSTDPDEMICLVEEIDLFLIKSETVYTNTYIDLLRNRIKEQSYFNRKITNSSPVLIFLLNVQTNKITFINETAENFVGLQKGQLVETGTKILENFVHPDDLQKTFLLLEEIKHDDKKEEWSYEFRLKDRLGNYTWMNNKICTFKKDEKGRPLEIIGNIMNIHAEKEASEELKKGKEELRKSEELYKQAQALSHTGHFSLDLKTHKLYLTDELKRIYRLDPAREHFEYADIIRLRHPDDQQLVDDTIKHTTKTLEPFELHYRIITHDGVQKLVHAFGEIKLDESGNADSLVGTIQDVTVHQNLLRQLQKKEQQHKQSEALTHIGSYSWDVQNDVLEWSDEMYRIYGLDPQGALPLNSKEVGKFIHPEDRQLVDDEVSNSIRLGKPHDFYYRIILSDNTLKILHARGEVIYAKDKPSLFIGTTQDVTEKQLLIRKLRESENVYKQAEALANMGNYVLDVKTNNIEWTDQLFVIFGLPPQSEKITLERFYGFIHEDDLAQVRESVKEFYNTSIIDYNFRIITPQKEVKTIRSIVQLQKDKDGNPSKIIGTAQDITERQLLVARLQESEILHKQAQALARLGNWTMDLNTNLFVWSDEMYNIYERGSRDQISFDTWAGYIHPQDRKSVIAYLTECIKNKTSYDRHHRIVLDNGKIKVLHRKAEFIFDAEGQPIQLIGTSQDVTEQFNTQQELRENQNFIQKIADATPSIIASYNIHTGKYNFISQGIKKLLGYDPELVREKGVQFFLGIVHPDDLAELMESNKEALLNANLPENRDKDEIIEFIYRMRHIEGHYVWFHTYGTIFDRNASGHVEHVLNISLDISDQHEAIQKIEEQEHFIQHIADASPTVLYVFNVQSNSFVYVNKEIFFVLGYTKEEIIAMDGDATEQLYHPDDIRLLPERKQSGKKIVDAHTMLQYECRMKNKDGEWQWFLVREVVFKTDAEGRIQQTVGAALDITRRKEMERSLLQNSFLLEQSNASLEEFAYVASHDLKEPLRKISTFGDRLTDTQASSLTPEGKLYLRKIVDASQRMQLMINDLLSISMISGNKGFEAASLQGILAETLQTLEYKIEQKNAIIKADNLPVANIVPSQFRQLFQNLISNSLKFVHEEVQPVITITCTYLKPEEVTHYQLHSASRFLKIQFDDNGIGFENEYAGKIFAIFQRLHGRSEYEGSGIGLAICKKIVEHHGGIIYASGIPDVGATFTIILPS
ncbi:MAG TPA: PAS domain-containing protein [Chitinophagaceae bacterium]|nr:PAS domain-containing protein [Chitinophagaceae bacterium]